jgi:hypothetical protein
MDRARDPRLRRREARAAARRRIDSLEARLSHPIYQPLAPWLGLGRSLDALNEAAAGICTESGQPIRFVLPAPATRAYEVRVFETGCIETRPDKLHDWFNALCWLAFPRTKARINALHAAEMPREGGRRGRLRDLLTIFDEGGALVLCSDEELVSLLRQCRWKELFWDRRSRVMESMRCVVLGHAVLEQALEPWPGITCKALFAAAGADCDSAAAQWLGRLPAGASPRDLAPLPVFGYPGWAEEQSAAFYDDARYFRPQGKAG